MECCFGLKLLLNCRYHSMSPDVRLLRNCVSLSTRLAFLLLFVFLVFALSYGLFTVKKQFDDFQTLKRYESYKATMDDLKGDIRSFEGALKQVGKKIQHLKVTFSLDPPSQMKRPDT